MRLFSPSNVSIALVICLVSQTTVLASGLDAWLAAHSISTVTKTTTSSVARPTSSKGALVPFTRCPANCSHAGYDPANWDDYHSVARLALCDQTMLLDFSLYNPLDDPLTHTSIRSCVAENKHALHSLAEKKETSASFSAGITVPMMQSNVTLQLAWINADKKGSISDLAIAVQEISDFMIEKSTAKKGIFFALSRETVVGVFTGSQIQQQDIVASILQDFVAEVKNRGFSDSVLIQLCGKARSSKYAIGVIANGEADIPFVQKAGNPGARGHAGSSAWKSITLSIPSPVNLSSNSTIGSSHTTNLTRRALNALRPRTTCSTVQANPGDTCTSLASECGITLSEFEDYNPSSTMCLASNSSLMSGQHVCCSSGTLPDFSPSPYSNGTCYTYFVQTGDSCNALAATWSLTVDEIESYNKDTWGWMGCGDLLANSKICLSSGSPPMPASIANAVCGPQVVGTPAAPSGTNLSTLNECPLNACCDIWGQCGTTSEFCTITQSTTGAPGTAAPKTNGCISNCGTEIVISDAPVTFMKVGYFEGFNTDRPCLNESVLDIEYAQYTHIHLAFGTITSDFDINVTAISTQFDMFLSLPIVKKILSVGGWAFSTDPSTFQLFRKAVLPPNQPTFVANIVAFVKKYGLDGVDFDWEYPGEPDIPGIPPSSSFDNIYYWEFVTLVKSSLNSQAPGTTVSIAAPASYWYLKAFPIAAIAAEVDYVIFMTYDLHGQWDYGHANADIGCPGGNCLRSGVNLTETVNALSMITKAGVPSNKIVVGVSSYGRSFQMTEAGCYGPMCTNVGPSSGAYRGICTKTAGYLGNAEIAYMNATMSSTYSYLDDSYSNILVFDETQWVSYMDDNNKAVRASLYEAYNFAGTTDWAIDLQGTAQSLIDICGKPTSSTGAPAPCISSGPVTCIAGTGDSSHKDLCNFTCGLGYCSSPCTCTANGTAKPLPIISAGTVYVCPATGLGISYSSLCSFACKYGYCPSDYCATSDSSICTGLVLDQVNSTLSPDFLTNQSTCADISTYGQLEKAWMWDEMDVPTELKNWVSMNGPFDNGVNTFTLLFGTPLGIGETFGRSCKTIEANCQSINCVDMQVWQDAGSGWKYLVVQSVANLNMALYAVLEAVNSAPSNYSALAPALFTEYYPSYTASEFSLIEILTAIGAGVAAIGALTGNALAGAAGTLFAGAVTDFTNYLSTVTGPDSSASVTDFSVSAWDWAGNLTSSLQDQWTSVITEGSLDMFNTFADGSWVDFRTDPILNDEIEASQLTDWYNYILVAGTINYLWTQASIYIYCMPMTQDDSTPSTFQRDSATTLVKVKDVTTRETANGDPIYYNPPGYSNIVNAKYNFTTQDMIQSSLTSWLNHGFNYTAPVDNSINTVLDMSINKILSGALWTMDGTFNLLVCHWNSTESIKAFFYNLNSPTNGGTGAPASWCTCDKDINGKEFSDYVTYVNEVSCICSTAGCVSGIDDPGV
ncbi:hypothetical protein F1880_009951 [Penicillium rolfsii]|nr:hypothetical protein F1880_009951 [Penicillium rolfsii]